MSTLTRLQIKNRARKRIRERLGMESYGDPNSWNDDISESADEIARRTWCFYTNFAGDFTSGTAAYPSPQMLRLKAITVTDSAGNTRSAAPITRPDMDRLYGDSWRTNPATGVPTMLIEGGISGGLQVSFYPTPNYTTTSNSGFSFEGYALPGATWAADSAVCPLPDRAEQLLIQLAALRRAERFPEDFGVHIPILEVRVTQLMGMLESEVIQLSEATSAADQGRRRWGGSTGYGGYR
jgi:hypothetical protein